jgi:hypothetical protein
MKYKHTIIIYFLISLKSISYSQQIAIVRTKLQENWGWGKELVLTGLQAKQLEELSEKLKDTTDRVGSIAPTSVVTIYDLSKSPVKLKKVFYFYSLAIVEKMQSKSDERELIKFISTIDKTHIIESSPYEEK